MNGDIFQAVADDTRRKIIHITRNNPMHVNAICEHFNISRPAVSKHIKILVSAQLMKVKQHGRHRICESTTDKLSEITSWISTLDQAFEKEPETDFFANFLTRLST